MSNLIIRIINYIKANSNWVDFYTNIHDYNKLHIKSNVTINDDRIRNVIYTNSNSVDFYNSDERFILIGLFQIKIIQLIN